MRGSQTDGIIGAYSQWIMEMNMTQEKVIGVDVVAPKKAKECDWLKKMDELSIGEVRKKYPKAFWIVGGVVLISLIL